MSEEYSIEQPAALPDLEAFTRLLESAMNDLGTTIGYCGWPDCPICIERGLLPEQRKEIGDREEHAG